MTNETLLSHEIETGLLSIDLRLRKLLDAASAYSRDEILRCLAEVEALRALAANYVSWAEAKVEGKVFPVSLALEPLAERFRPIAAARGIVVEMPSSADGALEVRGDPCATERILSNLLANAIDFSPEGERVSVRAERRGDSVEIAVEDRGVGIAPEAQERVFEPFVQLDRERPGAGLGLALARRLADAQGGRLTLTSEPGLGSRFVLALPAS